MKNITLNLGGLFGGIISAILSYYFLIVNASSSQNGRAIGKFLIFTITAGAFLGNFLWGVIFPKKDIEEKKSTKSSGKKKNFEMKCNNCNSILEASSDILGQVLNCPNCNGLIKVKKPKA